ncbi:shikimate kinase [Noviluteimonas dokdonensis]|nr:shikimate kinase [Lysobacter dokdonensis]
MNPAPHLVLVGPMGAGKTSIGRRIAARLGLPFTDMDAAIEERAGTKVALIFEVEGEAGFRAREREMLAELLLHTPSGVIATGGGVVLDADNRRLLQAHAFVVHLDLGVDGQLERLARDRTRPLLQRPDREAVLHSLAGERGGLYAEIADLRFSTEGMAAHDAALRLARLVDGQWQRSEAAA